MQIVCENDDSSSSFSFEFLEKGHFFEENKKLKEFLIKWSIKIVFFCENVNFFRGMRENLNLLSFRFNLNFNELNIDAFLRDFFNDPLVKANLPFVISSIFFG